MKELVARLTWVDYLTAIAILRGIYIGYKTGLFQEILRVITYLASVIVTLLFYGMIAQQLTLTTFLNESASRIVAFAVLLAVALLVTKLLSRALLKLMKIGEGSPLARIAGALLGACRWVLLLSLTFMLIDHLPLSSLKTDIHTRSLAGPRVVQIAPTLFEFMNSLSPKLALPKA